MSGLFGSTTIKGTRITDFAQTSAEVGKPIPFGYGRFPVDGNVIWAHLPPIEVRRVEDVGGKGGGTKQETFVYITNYAIAFCLGPIYGFWTIKRNGKVVYSTDPNAPVEDHDYSQKWLERATLYYGSMNQLPDSTIESFEGSGKVSAFHGLAYIVVEGEETPDGAIAQYEAVPIATPPEAYLTSKPYPIDAADVTSLSLKFNSANLTTRLKRAYGEDAAQLDSSLTWGILKDAYVKVPYEDDVILDTSLEGGQLRSLIINTNYNDSITLSASLDSGQLKRLLVQQPYNDNITLSASLEGGTLS